MLCLYKVELFYQEDSRYCKTWYSVIEDYQTKEDAIKSVKDALLLKGENPFHYYYLGSYISNNIVSCMEDDRQWY